MNPIWPSHYPKPYKVPIISYLISYPPTFQNRIVNNAVKLLFYPISLSSSVRIQLKLRLSTIMTSWLNKQERNILKTPIFTLLAYKFIIGRASLHGNIAWLCIKPSQIRVFCLFNDVIDDVINTFDLDIWNFSNSYSLGHYL